AQGRFGVSATTPEGDAAIWQALVDRARTLLPADDVPALNERQRRLCRGAHKSLCVATSVDDALIIAEEFRLARTAFDAVTGRSHVEDVLDALFGRFCIGK
ncbi:MAG: tRNA uridine-5-carboxymethylaminomethyl(34) synthesis GTPase MnmE, partial [Sphingomonadales bacterium]|nr:tRNA uridine-5-carboxymethylaminomethyl(34) synthesis GTPase MnmE [Sphingomonadales bacterium]